MMILPLSKLPRHQQETPPLIPLVLCIPVEGDWLRSVDRELLIVSVASALRGVIKNTLAVEHGNVLSYWMRKSANFHSRDKLMVEVDEVYEMTVDVFAAFADQLSRFRTLDHLFTELVGYDADDGSIIVRISDG